MIAKSTSPIMVNQSIGTTRKRISQTKTKRLDMLAKDVNSTSRTPVFVQKLKWFNLHHYTISDPQGQEKSVTDSRLLRALSFSDRSAGGPASTICGHAFSCHDFHVRSTPRGHTLYTIVRIFLFNHATENIDNTPFSSPKG